MKLKVIIEISERELWGRIENIGDFTPVTVGTSKQQVLENLVLLIEDYQKHEGAEDEAWKKIDIAQAEFELTYDLQAFFQVYNFLKQSKIAELFGVTPGLVRQYAAGVKHPSAQQAMKIEKAIHALAQQLQAVSIYAA